MNPTHAPTIAVLGLGVMGTVFVRRAREAGLLVTAWDRAQGAAAGDAVRDADLVVTVLYDADAVLSVMRAAVPAMQPHATWLQMSTIGVEGTRRAVDLAATRPGVGFLDAPVSGTKTVAEHGGLVVFASGDRARMDVAQPFLSALAEKVHWMGEAGAGTRAGLLFNAWIAFMIEGVAEVAILAQALGVDVERFAELAADGRTVPPWALDKFARIARNADAVEVPLRLARKNTELALAAAGSARLPSLAGAAALWSTLGPAADAADISALWAQLSSGDADVRER